MAGGLGVTVMDAHMNGTSVSSVIDNATSDAGTLPSDPLVQLQFHAYSIALPIVLLLGFIGNGLNIMVLTRSRFRHSLDESEQCAAVCMLAMAVSDLAFCLVGLPSPLLSRHVSMKAGANTLQMIAFYYATYRTPMMNLFLFSSTWLVVVVALERYLAVCRPFTRGHHRLRNYAIVAVSVFITSILFNLPGFLKYEIKLRPCLDGGRCYIAMLTSLYQSTGFRRFYRGMWLALGALLPLVVMAICNAHLLSAIFRSRQRNRIEGAENRYSVSRITVILVLIVTLFLILVFPSTLLGFIGDMVLPHEDKHYFGYQVAIVAFNFTQAVYFALNFVLYCSVSRAFRESVGCPPMCLRELCWRYRSGHSKYRSVVFIRARNR